MPLPERWGWPLARERLAGAPETGPGLPVRPAQRPVLTQQAREWSVLVRAQWWAVWGLRSAGLVQRSSRARWEKRARRELQVPGLDSPARLQVREQSAALAQKKDRVQGLPQAAHWLALL